ncbi:MAG: hypothetical protein ACRC91_00800, partial [Aeromonas sp.]
PIRSGYNLSVLNDNFVRIQNEMNNNLIHARGGGAFMDQELDMNSNRVINVGKPVNDYDLARLIDVKNEPGRQGPVGPEGPIGPQGIQGPIGIQGIQGVQGLQGPIGPVGPVGSKGDKGDSFTVNAVGTYADRSLYDDRPALFSYLAYDIPASGVGTPSEMIDSHTGDGATTVFACKFPKELFAALLVYIGGSIQKPLSYNLDGGNIIFSEPPFEGAKIEIRYLSGVAGEGAIYFKLTSDVGDWSLPIPFGRGPQGIAGEQGPVGPTGPQGEPGIKGEQGDRGPQGIQGLPGLQGSIGPQGPSGPAGPQGVKGEAGDKGDRGDVGQRGSRTIYVSSNSTSWNPSLIQSAMQAAGYWPPVDYDLGTQYNEAAKFSTTYRWFNGRWDSRPVELVEGGVLKVMNSVDASELLPNSVSAPFKSGAVWTKSGNGFRFAINLNGVDTSAFMRVNSLTFSAKTYGNVPPTGFGIWKINVYINDVLKSSYSVNTGYSSEYVGEDPVATNYTSYQVEVDVLDLGVKAAGGKRVIYEVLHEAVAPTAGTLTEIQTTVSGISFKV